MITDHPDSSCRRPPTRPGTSLRQRALCAAMLPLLLAACTSAPRTTPVVVVPDKLKPGSGEALVMIVPATGVQIYECRAGKDQPTAHEWVFVAPEADLFDTRGNRIGRHYAGPHWEANDGSKIVASVKERSDAPRGDAIPWLLLSASPVVADGRFGRVTSIQRVNTVGGKAPAGGCSQATAGAAARVAYTADYHFFSTK